MKRSSKLTGKRRSRVSMIWGYQREYSEESTGTVLSNLLLFNKRESFPSFRAETQLLR
jgi:hypothetical protein